MTRRLLALFAPSMLAAQVKLTPTTGGGGRIPRPKNGECPVCGTLAKPFRVSIPVGPSTCLQYNDEPHHKAQCEAWERWDEVRMVACAHCNNVFRQWAQGKEPKR